MQTYDEIELEVRKLAHSLPPSDFGSTRAIQAVAQYVMKKIEDAHDAGWESGKMAGASPYDGTWPSTGQ